MPVFGSPRAETSGTTRAGAVPLRVAMAAGTTPTCRSLRSDTPARPERRRWLEPRDQLARVQDAAGVELGLDGPQHVDAELTDLCGQPRCMVDADAVMVRDGA